MAVYSFLNKQTMYGAVGVNTNSNVQTNRKKITLNLKQSGGGTIPMFHLHNSPRVLLMVS